MYIYIIYNIHKYLYIYIYIYLYIFIFNEYYIENNISDQGKFREAGNLLHDSLTIRESTLGKDHPAVSVS